jgi:adenosylcobinamide-GDP ribazoletransferase
MKQQLNLFFHALMFYSRIPAGKIDYSEENLTKAFRYFPVVGILVGAIGGGVFLLFRLIFPDAVGIAAALAAMTLFDGFGGGQTKERILAIMKDSTVGAYGVTAIVLLFLIKFSILSAISPASMFPALIAAHASSRVMPVVLINTSQYARKENSKAMHTRHRTDGVTFSLAVVYGALPLLFIPWQTAVILIPAYALIWFLLKRYTERKIGGFTGDVLGAMQQFSELAFYLVFVGIQSVTL